MNEKVTTPTTPLPKLKKCWSCNAEAEYNPNNGGSARCSTGRSRPLECAGAYIFLPVDQWNTRTPTPAIESLQDAVLDQPELPCPQCGRTYSEPACGPTHAIIQHEQKQPSAYVSVPTSASDGSTLAPALQALELRRALEDVLSGAEMGHIKALIDKALAQPLSEAELMVKGQQTALGDLMRMSRAAIAEYLADKDADPIESMEHLEMLLESEQFKALSEIERSTK